jgi:hypothetical protein
MAPQMPVLNLAAALAALSGPESAGWVVHAFGRTEAERQRARKVDLGLSLNIVVAA